MTSESFHCFSSLPPELRQEIYKLATHPRIVHVQEHSESRRSFNSRFAGQVSPPNLDPSLAYFAFNWRLHLPFLHGRQRSLEDFGFRGARKVHPWTPSDDTPEIPLHWLSDHEAVAWELTRKAELYSRAPIPALLHTCSESRSTLIRWGYVLSFATRSEEPKTWFKFDADILYLKQHPLADDWNSPTPSTLLSGGSWDVGQFLPRDLRKVRGLALENAAVCMEGYHLRSTNTQSTVLEVANLVRLFGNLDRLLLVDWNRSGAGYCIPRTESRIDFDFSDESVDEGSETRSYEEPDLCRYAEPEPGTYEQPESWNCVAVEEIDALISLFFPRLDRPGYIRAAGKFGKAIRAYQRSHTKDFDTSFWTAKEGAVKERLMDVQNVVLETNVSERTTRWQIPMLRAVHVMRQSQLGKLKSDRRQVLEHMVQEKAEISTDADEQTLLARWLSIWSVEDKVFAPSKEEEEAMAMVVEEDEILAQRDFENAEIDDLQQQWFSRRKSVVDEYAMKWADDEEAYFDNVYQNDYNWSPALYADDEPDPDDVDWWIQKGWFPMLDNPDLELRTDRSLDILINI